MRRPASSTATRQPFSASRSAATLPPKPEPMTIQSKSKALSGIRVSTVCTLCTPSVVFPDILGAAPGRG